MPKGTISFGNKEDLIAILKRLTLHYENNNTASTTVFDNLTSEIHRAINESYCCI